MFIAGTGTDIGKTQVVGMLARRAQASGLRVITQKWVQTGVRPGDKTDLDAHDAWFGAQAPDLMPWRLPYRFEPAVSVHLAAQLAQTPIDWEVIKSAYFELKKRFDLVIVEGAGGAFSPVSAQLSSPLMTELAQSLGLPIWVVVPNEVGGIHAGVATLAALNARGVCVAGVILNQRLPDVDPLVLADNAAYFQQNYPGLSVDCFPFRG